MTYTIQHTVYKTPEGVVTHEDGGGKNTVLLVPGAVVSRAKADELKLAELDAATQERVATDAVADPLAGLKPPVKSELVVSDDKTKTPPKGAVKTEEK